MAVKAFTPALSALPRFIRADLKPPVTAIVACTTCGGIGLNGGLPWSITTDSAFFESISRETYDPSKLNGLVMGRNTWESMTERPIPRRRAVVLTHRDL